MEIIDGGQNFKANEILVIPSRTGINFNGNIAGDEITITNVEIITRILLAKPERLIHLETKFGDRVKVVSTTLMLVAHQLLVATT